MSIFRKGAQPPKYDRELHKLWLSYKAQVLDKQLPDAPAAWKGKPIAELNHAELKDAFAALAAEQIQQAVRRAHVAFMAGARGAHGLAQEWSPGAVHAEIKAFMETIKP